MDHWRLHENQLNYLSALCEDIKSERKRIGGHWVIADCHLIKKPIRDFIGYIYRLLFLN